MTSQMSKTLTPTISNANYRAQCKKKVKEEIKKVSQKAIRFTDYGGCPSQPFIAVFVLQTYLTLPLLQPIPRVWTSIILSQVASSLNLKTQGARDHILMTIALRCVMKVLLPAVNVDGCFIECWVKVTLRSMAAIMPA